MAALESSLQEQRLVEAALARRGTPLHGRERLAEAALGGGFLLACLALVVLAPPAWAAVDLDAAVAAAVALGAAMHVHFVVGTGYTVPTQLAFVPLAFALPPALVPPAVVLVLVASQLVDVYRGRLSPSRLALVPANAWFSVGPAAVLAAAGAPAAADASVALVAAMLAAQVAVDLGSVAVRELLHGAFDRRELLAESWIYLVDAALTPVAFVAAITVGDRPWVVLAMMPLLGILHLFAREREARMRSLIELNTAYQGISLVLGDVVEADDGYTGEHCREVVELAVAVGGHLGLPPDRMRNLEFGALLHDVGKVAIPKEIINKPGALSPEEWALVKTHTIEGQRMLDRVGGFMSEVGTIVRGHHERWDGGGYPDGLAGADIPLEARIICCCDSWNAMTTDRAYRPALPIAVAVAEMRANAGTQFDPAVVRALLTVIGEEAVGHPAAERSAVLA
jgi:HD-GYP domain-containing protein (c-di-GMP phosphodiesterase class II)